MDIPAVPVPSVPSDQEGSERIKKTWGFWLIFGSLAVATVSLWIFILVRITPRLFGKTLNNEDEPVATTISSFSGIKPVEDLPGVVDIYGTVNEIDESQMLAAISLQVPSYIQEAFWDKYDMSVGQSTPRVIHVKLTGATLIPDHGNSISPISIADGKSGDSLSITELQGRYVRILAEKGRVDGADRLTALQFWYATFQ